MKKLEILELKNEICKIRNLLHGLNSRMEIIKERSRKDKNKLPKQKTRDKYIF